MMEKKQKQVPADLAEKQNNMPLTVANYKLMLIGLAIIIIGYVLMTGGGSDDPNVFNVQFPTHYACPDCGIGWFRIRNLCNHV